MSMFSRGNKRKDKLNKQIKPDSESEKQTDAQEPVKNAQEPAQNADKPADEAPMTREELLEQDENAKEMYERIKSLRQSVEAIKEDNIPEEFSASGDGSRDTTASVGNTYPDNKEEIANAEQAIIEQARRDKELEKLRLEEARQSEAEAEKARAEAERARVEAEQRAALKAAEAERKKQAAREAEKTAASDVAEETGATEDEIEEFFSQESSGTEIERGTEAGPQEEPVSPADDQRLKELPAEQQAKLTQQGLIIEQERALLVSMIDEYKTESETWDKKQLSSKAKALKKQRTKVERLVKEERQDETRKLREAKVQKKREEKLKRAGEKERAKLEKKEQARQKKLQKKYLEKRSKEDAELGGGVVNVKGVSISTEIKEVPNVTVRDFLGTKTKEERKTDSKARRRQLREEREKRREAARQAISFSWRRSLDTFENSAVGRRLKVIRDYCERHKRPLLIVFAVIIVLVVGAAGVYNYFTAYEYSYNGKTLGLVKNKDDVIRITDLVQGALTEDKDVQVVIDAKNDIEFTRVMTSGDVQIDTSEEVLKRLTYMGDLNVKAYGIYVDGKKIGAVEDKDTAAKVLEDIKDKYSSDREGAEIEEAVFLENVEIKESNTDLQDIETEKEMVDHICTGGEKVTKHKVVKGETLSDVAKEYSVKEDTLVEDNPGVDPTKLKVGSTLTIRQPAPLVTVQITEQVTYDKKIKYKTKKKKSSDMYEGDSQVKQKGENGVKEVTSRIVLVNGEETEETPLVSTVKKEAVNKVVVVGTKERPSSVGTGDYIWPLSGGYTLSSGFGSRWGRSHEGIDLACSVGSDVLAADGGIVTYAGYSGGYGYLITIDHQNGMSTRYGHNSKLLVKVGDEVYQGQHIAESGSTGRSTGPHVHFEVRVNGEAKNPMNYLP